MHWGLSHQNGTARRIIAVASGVWREKRAHCRAMANKQKSRAGAQSLPSQCASEFINAWLRMPSIKARQARNEQRQGAQEYCSQTLKGHSASIHAFFAHEKTVERSRLCQRGACQVYFKVQEYFQRLVEAVTLAQIRWAMRLSS